VDPACKSAIDAPLPPSAQKRGRSPTLDQDVRDSIQRIKDSPFIPKKGSVRGFIYDTKSGELRETT
jgi:carbonic anhydrase